MKKKTILDMIEEAINALGSEQTWQRIIDEVKKRNPEREFDVHSLRTMLSYGSKGEHRRWERVRMGVFKPLVPASEPEAQPDLAAAPA